MLFIPDENETRLFIFHLTSLTLAEAIFQGSNPPFLYQHGNHTPSDAAIEEFTTFLKEKFNEPNPVLVRKAESDIPPPPEHMIMLPVPDLGPQSSVIYLHNKKPRFCFGVDMKQETAIGPIVHPDDIDRFEKTKESIIEITPQFIQQTNPEIHKTLQLDNPETLLLFKKLWKEQNTIPARHQPSSP